MSAIALLTDHYQYYLYARPTDMRKSFDGLCGIVQNELARAVADRDIFIFLNKEGTHIKLLLREADCLLQVKKQPRSRQKNNNMSKPYLTIQGIASPSSLRKILTALKKADLESNCQFLFFDYSEFDIPVGVQFNRLTNITSGESFEIKGYLKLVTQNQGLVFDGIPQGHKTIGKVCLDGDSLTLVKDKIPIVDTWQILNVNYVLST